MWGAAFAYARDVPRGGRPPGVPGDDPREPPRGGAFAHARSSRDDPPEPRVRAQSGRVRGSPKPGRPLLSKRVTAQIRPAASVTTSSPVAWAILARGSRTYIPNAGWPLARVATSR